MRFPNKGNGVGPKIVHYFIRSALKLKYLVGNFFFSSRIHGINKCLEAQREINTFRANENLLIRNGYK